MNSVKLPTNYRWFLNEEDIRVINCYPDERSGVCLEVKYNNVPSATFVYRFSDRMRNVTFFRLISSCEAAEGYEIKPKEKQYFQSFFKKNQRKKDWEYENLWIRENQLELLNILQKGIRNLDNEHKFYVLIYLEGIRHLI